MATLVLVFKTTFDNFYSSSKAEKMINESDIDDAFQSIYTTIITNIQKSLGKRSDWITDSVIDHTISVSKYKCFSRKQLYKITKRIRPSKNIQKTDDNEYFKLYLVRYLKILLIISQQELQKLTKILPKA